MTQRRHVVIRNLADVGLTGPGSRGPSIGLEARGVAPPEISIESRGLTPSEVNEIAREPDVVGVAPAMPTVLIEPKELPEERGTQDADEAATWGLAEIGADRSPHTGHGIVVAVLDTGIDSEHAAFSGVELDEKDFSGSGDGDRNGHGTHCAGTIFGREVEGKRIGVATSVTKALIGKVLGDDGRGSSEMAFQAITWATENGANVVSMSLGFDFPGLVKRLEEEDWPVDLATSVALEAYRGNLRVFDALMALIRARAAFGQETLVIAAAGNESRRELDDEYEIAASLPAAADGVISVGAVGRTGAGLRVADFSNTFPTLSALSSRRRRRLGQGRRWTEVTQRDIDGLPPRGGCRCSLFRRGGGRAGGGHFGERRCAAPCPLSNGRLRRRYATGRSRRRHRHGVSLSGAVYRYMRGHCLTSFRSSPARLKSS